MKPLLARLVGISIVIGVGFSVLMGISTENSITLTVCASGCDFTTIQAAIDAAQPGGIVEIQEGSYQDNIIVNKAVTLKGKGINEVRLIAKEEGKPGILIAGDSLINVNVIGFMITGAKGSCVEAIRVCPFGVSVFGASTVTIRKTHFVANKYGVVAGEESQIMILESIFTDNETAIMLRDRVRATIGNTYLEGNHFGILMGHDVQAILEDNTISKSYAPVRVWDQSRVTIIRNIVSENMTGIIVKDQADATIMANSFADNDEEALWLSGQAVTRVQENSISGHKWGIGLAQHVTANIVQNEIIENDWGVLIWTDLCTEEGEPFAGRIIGRSNEIPDPNEPHANKQGDVCPTALRFLKTEQGGEYP